MHDIQHQAGITHHLIIRPAHLDDSQYLCRLLNEIIEIGGTTAYQTLLSCEEFAEHFITGRSVISSHVAVDSNGLLCGFQTLTRHPELPENQADIATFASVKPKIKGVGRALFEETLSYARQRGIHSLNATIRADNVGGLAYYEKIGFRTYKVHKAVPLADGTPVDRIAKQLQL